MSERLLVGAVLPGLEVGLGFLTRVIQPLFGVFLLHMKYGTTYAYNPQSRE